MAAIFALLLQGALFAVHDHPGVTSTAAPACAAPAAVDRATPAGGNCSGKTSAVDRCGVCQTLQHTRGGLAPAFAHAAAIGFTIVDRDPAACTIVVASPADFKLPARAPPHLV